MVRITRAPSSIKENPSEDFGSPNPTEDEYRFTWREDDFDLIKVAEGYFAAQDVCERFLPR